MASVRLAEASARCRLSETITIEDVENALSVLDATIGNRFDSESGEFDANIVDNSVTKSQKDRIDTIKDLLSEMQRGDEYEKAEGVPFSEFKEVALEYGIEASKIEHEIEQLKRRGEVYEPRSGTVWST
jgi:replicative DNA helicase Mcm